MTENQKNYQIILIQKFKGMKVLYIKNNMKLEAYKTDFGKLISELETSET